MPIPIPMLMSFGTFYPVDTHPALVAAVAGCLPLRHDIEMLRDLNAGVVGWLIIGHAPYFAVLAMPGVWVVSLHFRALFLQRAPATS